MSFVPVVVDSSKSKGPQRGGDGPVVGIDLGTTFSLVAVLEDGRPRVLPNALGDLLTPSAVSVLDDGTVLVGAAARARATTAPESTAVCFKRDMGLIKSRRLGNRTFTPPELSALVLKSLVADAEAALGQSVRRVVITVPAYFAEPERSATRQAAELAGLEVARLVNEPTAAALAHGVTQRTDDVVSVVVLDLGGGTFDVTVLELFEAGVEIRSSAGDGRLGGEDFTEALAVAIAAEVRARTGASPARGVGWARVHAAAELAKRALRNTEIAPVTLPDLELDDRRKVNFHYGLPRAVADACYQPLVERLEPPLRRALRDAGLSFESVDRVLLVGGSTRLDCVRALVERLFPRAARDSLDDLPPDEAVALGAAVQAGLSSGDVALADVVATDIASHSLGISCSQSFRHGRVEGVFSPIIERGTVIPVSRVGTYWTVTDGQTELSVDVYQGDHRMAADNVRLGGTVLRGLPPRPAGEVGVSVRFSYDPSALLEVDLEVIGTDHRVSFVIEPSHGALTPDELERRRRQLATLKVHPRDLLPNATAQARADALYAELRGFKRQELGTLMSAFQVALANQDRAVVDAARIALLSAIERYS